MGRLDGRLEEELSSDGEERHVFCPTVIGCNTSMASMRHASLSLQYQFHVTRDWVLAKRQYGLMLSSVIFEVGIDTALAIALSVGIIERTTRISILGASINSTPLQSRGI